jgi:signal transduction histidine kinase
MGSPPDAGSGQVPALAGELAALRRVAMLVARAVPPTEVFAAAAEEVGRVLQADRTFLARYNPDATATLVAAWSAAGEDAPVSYHGPLPEGGPAALVQATGRPVRVDRSPEDSLLAARGVRSGVIAPITVDGRLWGFMTVGSVTGSPPPETEARLADFTELVAAAIANADAREELRHVADEQAALQRVATLVARGAEPDAVFATVAQEVGALFGADITAIVRFEPDGEAMLMGGHGATWREPGRRFTPTPGSAVASVRATGRATRLDADGPAPADLPEIFQTQGVRSAVNAPVVVEGHIWGTVGVAARRERLPPDTEDRLAGFTELVATAIANAQARVELRGFADEQAALRRVATLVARAAPPEEVFTAVTEEAGRLLDADLVSMNRYDPGGMVTVLAARPAILTPQWSLGGRNVSTLVVQTGRPARIDDYAEASGPGAVPTWEWGVRSAVGAPITVEGRLWGVMFVASRHKRALPAGTEDQLAGFTELAATAIANAEAQAALRASRARIVAAADATRRRIERDLHDGAQQRVVSLALQLRAAQADMPTGATGLDAQLDRIGTELTGLLNELREFARGIHPAILAEGGLGPALRTLARRSPIPVELDMRAPGRLPESAEVCAYYVVSEALANAAKHSRAAAISVHVTADDDLLNVRVGDDGAGGARLGAGTGLIGLKDRVEALGGHFTLHSQPGAGTTVTAQLPLTTHSS